MKLLVHKSKLIYSLFLSFTLIFLVVFLVFKPFNSKNMAINLFNTCSIDNIVGAASVQGIWVANKNSQITFQGWVGDSSKTISADNILLELVDVHNGVIRSEIRKTDFERLDVAKVYNNPAMRNSGFNIVFSPIAEPGDYTVLLGSLYPSVHSICTNSFKLRISG